MPLLGRDAEPTLFELSHPGRSAWSFRTTGLPETPIEELVPAEHRRTSPVPLAEVSERDLVAHFTRLSHRQFSVDLGAYPLGSCTMKYNPKVCDTVAGLPGLAGVHPAAPASLTQGWLALWSSLEEDLCEITGMAAATLQPAAGAAGELTGLLLMRAWHDAQGSTRHKVIIPDSAHGTNPASVTLGGYEVVTVPSDERGCVDMASLRTVLDEDVAGIMLTNPNTLGLFEEDIAEIAAAVHEVGGLLYYDGANLNAILGVVRPGDMGFDIVHMNLHKTFATPHGGGGPGAGPVAVSERLVPFLPGPRPTRLGGDGPTPTAGWCPSSPSAACTPGTATPWYWPGPWPTSRPTGATASAVSPRSPCSTPTGSGSVSPAPSTSPSTGRACTRSVLSSRTSKSPTASCPRCGQAPARRGLSFADRLLPPHRGRGAHDRADRDREPADPAGPGRGPGADRIARPCRMPVPRCPRPLGQRRCVESTRPGRPGRSSPPSTPGHRRRP